MSIEFIPAVCPKCGGELRVPSNIDQVKCMYCGCEIILPGRESDKSSNISNLLSLAETTEKAKNFTQADEYYSRVLEIDNQNPSTWLGKARCAAQQTTNSLPRIEEAITYISQASQLGIVDTDEMTGTIVTLAKAARVYTQTMAILLKETLDNNTAQYHGGPFFGMAFTRVTEECANIFITVHGPRILKVMNFLWKSSPGLEIADEISSILQTINDAFLFNVPKGLEAKNGFFKQTFALQQEIKTKYPNWQIIKPVRKDCFIATATFGDPNHPDVLVLRRFRDDCLSQNWFGKLFVRLYYFLSPPFAWVIASNKSLRILCYRHLVRKWVAFANKALRD
jgi:DNA-directed RNA polymerase subunit RPC12/RpoP